MVGLATWIIRNLNALYRFGDDQFFVTPPVSRFAPRFAINTFTTTGNRGDIALWVGGLPARWICWVPLGSVCRSTTPVNSANTIGAIGVVIYTIGGYHGGTTKHRVISGLSFNFVTQGGVPGVTNTGWGVVFPGLSRVFVMGTLWFTIRVAHCVGRALSPSFFGVGSLFLYGLLVWCFCWIVVPRFWKSFCNGGSVFRVFCVFSCVGRPFDPSFDLNL